MSLASQTIFCQLNCNKLCAVSMQLSMCSQKIITPSPKSFKSHAVFCLKDFHNVMKSFLNEYFLIHALR